MPEIGVALSRLGNDASFIALKPAQEQRVREMIKELEAIYLNAKQQLAT
jgi:hypothetical protein